MAASATRWVMTAPKAPMAPQAFAPQPAPGEVAVAIAGCGVCHTDLGYYYDGVRVNHALPLALGHEGSELAAAGLALEEVSVVADAVTTPYEAVRRAGVAPGSLAIVIGVGGVGGYCVQIAAAAGAKVVAIDVDERKLEAMKPHGAALTLNARSNDQKALKTAIAAFAKGEGLRATAWLASSR